MATPTRDDYMQGRCTHAAFYRAVNKTAGLVISDTALLQRVSKCLAEGDEHLNRIPLSFWDGMGPALSGNLRRALKEHGDFWSMAGSVCCLKQAARDAAMQLAGMELQP